MARTRKWDVRTDRRTGRTGVNLMPFRYSLNRRGHNNYFARNMHFKTPEAMCSMRSLSDYSDLVPNFSV